MATWAQVAVDLPAVATTTRAYLGQIAVVPPPGQRLGWRLGGVSGGNQALRCFATYLLSHYRDLTSVSQLGPTHIEGFPNRGCPQGRP